ncbi:MULTISPECIES: hypothetical protein [Streptomyces]|uniref:hypothetical protein n=1 Tax=Streptomyces TaxID=1883 RepID=UPI0004CCFE94|nr:hypothetical protein [Streptomyces sp. NRRL S-623]WTF73151.1 hypothetical protein OH770_32860 [Streptomyces microflavus]
MPDHAGARDDKHGEAMEEEIVGAALAAGLDASVVEALTETGALHKREYQLDRWLVNGRSRAPVAVALEMDHRTLSTQRLLLKVPATDDTGIRLIESEYVRHRNAYDEAPAEFAEAHLTRPVREPVRVGKGRFVTFQAIAGDDIESVEVLTALLNSMLGTAAEDATEIACTAGDFAEICGTVVRGVLHSWNGRPRTRPQAFTVAEFLGLHIQHQLEPGGRLHALSMEHRGDRIEIAGEVRPLVNPFALAGGALFGDRRIVRGLVGRTHGDLHTDNVLVRVHPAVDAAAFHLIDLALYEPEGPMTRDPAHLLLYILARRMDTLSAVQREGLLDYVIAPDEHLVGRLPNWLVELITCLDRAFLGWLEGSGLQPEWRRQRLLSLAGCAMLFLGRKSTNSEDRAWFLRLAARAADRFVGMPGLPAPDPAAARSVPVSPPAWRALPDPLPVTWISGLVRPRTAARTALELHLVPFPPVERLAAGRLEALKEGLVAAGREARLFQEDEEVRQDDPGVAAGSSGAGLAVTRTGQRSAWSGLPNDRWGAILDRNDLAVRLRGLLDALLRVPAPESDGFGIALSVETGGLVVSEGPVHTSVRPRLMAAAPRLLADEVLVRHELASRGGAVADELAERLLLAFSQGTEQR